ncbi:MAG: hypothetical protein A3A97_03185 [Candidatus Terrybacteria bacterium RIFCSPLOWO2_01_FULL_40_23]|uniref:GTPase Obg n=1 Tax=Candidatus Terrybacteria bacterium RIFCSPLOWO2_01_FULL_40_23 TaxID=1802366 RepID=A0A1G2PSG6_9BACT|nr:MAG: hypothetical protein A3A97_03185 [Candidatus Terrybacteria bacterium RIFCSPLOWO2_01_FULL_40_23]
MLVDDVTIKVQAGDGGKGAVAFHKTKMSLGPAGGSGGDGGNIYFEGISDLGSLQQFRYRKEFFAQSGKLGGHQLNDGPNGEDIILKVPVGTVIHNKTKGTNSEITKIGERLLAVRGGRGGKGNFLFRSSRNTSPKQFQKGLPGEQFTIRLELKLIADVGFIGIPNAGKSSLLNELTNAQSKVANYPFTTLEPNLGTYYELILADIPGLIEGASLGKGLGIKFLKHVERTKLLFHLVAADAEKPFHDYKTIRKELGAYNKSLLKKKEIVFLSKSDTVDTKELKKKIAQFKKNRIKAYPFSIHDWDTLEKVKKILNKLIKEKYVENKNSPEN